MDAEWLSVHKILTKALHILSLIGIPIGILLLEFHQVRMMQGTWHNFRLKEVSKLESSLPLPAKYERLTAWHNANFLSRDAILCSHFNFHFSESSYDESKFKNAFKICTRAIQSVYWLVHWLGWRYKILCLLSCHVSKIQVPWLNLLNGIQFHTVILKLLVNWIVHFMCS